MKEGLSQEVLTSSSKSLYDSKASIKHACV